MKWKIAGLLVLVALPGVVALSWLALPLMVDTSTIPLPLETLQIATTVQSTILVVAAAVLGAAAAPRVGLSAPVLSALAGRGHASSALRPQLMPGFLGGVAGALMIVGFHAFLPDALQATRERAPLPLIVRMLYGGITEEVVLRWGLMTVIVWGLWKLFRRGASGPSGAVMVTAIVASALVFGASHLPAVALSVPALTPAVVTYVTLGNALFGVVAGYLFWRRGLEAAMIAHGVAHLLAFLVRG